MEEVAAANGGKQKKIITSELIKLIKKLNNRYNIGRRH